MKPSVLHVFFQDLMAITLNGTLLRTCSILMCFAIKQKHNKQINTVYVTDKWSIFIDSWTNVLKELNILVNQTWCTWVANWTQLQTPYWDIGVFLNILYSDVFFFRIPPPPPSFKYKKQWLLSLLTHGVLSVLFRSQRVTLGQDFDISIDMRLKKMTSWRRFHDRFPY